MTFRLTVTPPGGSPVTLAPTIMAQVSANLALVILMGADPAFDVVEPEEYRRAQEFAGRLARAPRNWEMKHEPSGFVFSINGRE